MNLSKTRDVIRFASALLCSFWYVPHVIAYVM